MDLWEVVLRLGAASLLGSLVGLERESHGRPAGLRTHTLVAVGSALLMMISIEVALDHAGSAASADPSRIAAQVVSGIGFLGAGTILREGLNIRGLTTAASLWVVSALGLACGAGYYIPAAVVTILTLATLMALSRFERAFLKGSRFLRELQIEADDRPGQLGRIASALGQQNANIKSVSLEPSSDPERIEIRLLLQMPTGLREEQLLRMLLDADGIHHVEFV